VNGLEIHNSDVVNHNGVIHVIPELLVPHHKRHDEHGVDISGMDSWDNWEEWLPAWTEQHWDHLVAARLQREGA